MTHLSFFICLLQLLLYYLVSDIQSQFVNVKNVLVKVVKSNCTENERNTCRNKYLQICYNKEICDERMTLDCLLPPGYDTDHTLLNAVAGNTFNYTNDIEIAVMKHIIVGVTPTTATDLSPLATSCEISRFNTTNGIRVQTSSLGGLYQFDLLIESTCNILGCHGHQCENCGSTTTLPTSKAITLDTSRTTLNTSTTLTMLNTTLGSLPTTISDSTTTGFKTTTKSNALPSFSSNITTTKEYSTPSSNGSHTSTVASEYKQAGDSSTQRQTTTIIVVSVVCFLVVLLVIMIYIYWRKHNRKSRTTPDKKNLLVANDGTEGDGKHFSNDHSNDVTKKKANLHREDAINEDDMVHVTTQIIDETDNSKGDVKGLISSKHIYTKDIASKEVCNEHEDNKTSNIITETPNFTEQINNGMEPIIIVNAETNGTIHQHKKKKKREKKRSDAEEGKPSTSEDLSIRHCPADDNMVTAHGTNNGYVPDDEQSDASLPKESDEQSKRKSDEIAINSSIDIKSTDNKEKEFISKSKSQNEDIKLSKSTENEDYSSSNRSQNNKAVSNSEDRSGNDVSPSDTGAVHHQAQSNGGVQYQEISRNDVENIAQAKVETFVHGKMSEMIRDVTEHTNNSVNQVKEEVAVLQQDITDQLRKQSNDFKEQIDKNTADFEKAEKKRQKKMQKLKDQINECKERIRIFEESNNESIQNQKLIEQNVKTSGGNQDDARREIIETKNEIQKLRDEMNRLSENLRQQISQQKGITSVPDASLFTKTSHVDKSPPRSTDLLRSRTASDDALYRRQSGSLATPDQYSELERKRKKKKKKKNRTPSIRFPGDGTVHIDHEDNTIDIEQIGPMEVQQVNRGIRLTGGNVEIDIKSPRKKTSLPQKDQPT